MMQQRAVDEAGNIWEVDGQGNAVRLVQPAQPAQSSGGVFSLPSDPAKAARDAAALEGANLLNEQRRRDLAQGGQGALQVGYRWKPDGSQEAIPGGPADPNNPRSRAGKAMRQGDADKLDSQVQSYAALKDALGGFQDAYAGNAWTGEAENYLQGAFGTGTPGQRDWWAAFRTADNAIRNQLFGASLTEGEKAAYEATTITPRMKPEQVRKNLERRVEIAQKALSRKVARIKAGGFSSEEVDAALGEYAPDFMPATGQNRTEQVPEANALINQAVRGGMSMDELNAALAGMGVGPVKPDQYAAAVRWASQNPGSKHNFGDATREVPTTAFERLSASPGAAGVVSAMNGFTAGGWDEIAGSIDSAINNRPLDEAITAANLAKRSLADANPGISLAGNVAGNLATFTGLGLGARALGVGARLGKYAPLAGDLAFGATTGALESNENRALGAGLGTFAAGVGRKLGQGATALTGMAFRGVQNAQARALASEGVPLTGGQILGGGAKTTEDLATSYPGVGQMITDRRGEGYRAWNANRFNEGLAPIGGRLNGETGEEAVAAMREAARRSYDDTLGGVEIPLDQQFAEAMQRATMLGERIPGVGEQFRYTLDNKVFPNIIQDENLITGKGLQAIKRGLAKDRRAFARHERGADLADAFDLVDRAIDDVAERASPGIGQNLRNSNAVYRNLSVLADAVNAGKNTDGFFTPAQLGQAATSNAKRFTGNINAATGDRPFFESQRIAQNVLPSKVPDSGSGARVGQMILPMMVGTGLGGVGGLGAGSAFDMGQEGAAVGSGLTLASMAAAGLFNSPAGRAAMQRALLNRNPVVERLGNRLVDDYSKRAGLLFRGVGTGIAGAELR